jgi:hypothetical protein
VQPPSPANQQVWPAPAAEPQQASPILPQPDPPAQPQPATWHEQPATWGEQQPGWAEQQSGRGEQQSGWGEQQPGWGGQQPGQQWGHFPPAVPAQPYAQGAQEKQKRGLGIFAAIAAVLAAVIAVAALVFVLANRSGDKGDPDVPTLAGKPPSDVQLRDEGSRISLSWKDPTNGTVSFIVAMAHPGEQLAPVSTLGPGKTSYEISALNPSLNYCFAVVAVYRDNKFATSQQACTERPTSTSSPK